MKKIISVLLLCMATLTVASLQAKEQGVYTAQYSKQEVKAAKKWMKAGAWRNGFTANPHSSVNAVDFQEQYQKNKGQWDAVFNWLATHDLLTIPSGKHSIEGTKLTVSVEDSENGPLEKRGSESHRRKIDLQFVVKGTERFGIIEHNTSKPNCEYRPDVLHYDYEKDKTLFYDSNPNEFFLFFPEDWHIAKINNDGEDQKIRVIVVKIDYVDKQDDELQVPAENLSVGDHYLYCHMSDRGEWTAYAIGKDGIHYHDLLGGEPVFNPEEHARIEGGTRDAYVCRKHDGSGFVMVTTDMCVRKSHQWWNYGIDLYTSDDLINWKSVTFDVRKGAEIFSDPESPDTYKDYSTVRRVWAPQILWNPNYKWADGRKGGYMIYYSMLNDKNGEDKYDRMYYSYADESFTTLTKPRLMFDWGYATIDADINYLESDGLYHMMIKKEGGKPGLFTATSVRPEGPYSQPVDDDYISFEGNKNCEGVSAFRIEGEKGWRIGYIEYSSNPKHYRICSADANMRNFKNPNDIEGVEAPQHGSFMRITKEEYDRLQAWSDSKEAADKDGKYLKPNANNPVFKGYHADPEILYSNKTKKFYIYPTTDGTPGWKSHDFHVFSSEDMKTWQDEGVMFDLQKDCSWADWNAWAPCIIEKPVMNKRGKKVIGYKYYYYYVADKRIGVAVADDPAGPFVDPIDKPLIEKIPDGVRGGQVIDPDVFMDPVSGKYYLYWGNGFLAVSELADDMISIVPGSTKVLISNEDRRKYNYNEGVYVFYRDGKYYFTWSENDTRSPFYQVRYLVSDSPVALNVPEENKEKTTEVGVSKTLVISADGHNQIWGTGHHSVIQHPETGEWFICYHRFTRHDAIKRGWDAGYYREVCIDPLTFDEKGNIIHVKPSL